MCHSGKLQLDCTPSTTGNTTQCYVAGQSSLQSCDPQHAGDPIKLPILMVSPSTIAFSPVVLDSLMTPLA